MKYLSVKSRTEHLILFMKTCKPYMGFNRSNTQLKKYYEWLANKLNDPNTSSKAYWSTIKTLVSGKKVLVVPPILVSNNVVTNFRDKTNICNDFFSKQCQLILNNSTLSSIQTFETSNRLSTIDFGSKKILKLIQSFNSNRALMDMILYLIRML